MGSKTNLNSFFRPKAIAIIGASQDFNSISGKPLRLLVEHGYRGALYPVNPKYPELLGLRCYPSVLAIPGEVDLALIAVASHRVPGVLQECASRGVKNAIIYSSGYAETGREGAELQRNLAELARREGLRICGPNCQGMVNLGDHVVATFSAAAEAAPLRAGSVGFATQSGALGYSAFNQAQEAGLGFSFMVNTGNEVDLNTLDIMEFLVEDEETTVVLGYLEGVPDPAKLSAIADEAIRKKKPLILLKAGRSAVGSRAAASHTAALTGSEKAFSALCRQKGIIRAHDIDELIDLAKAFAPGCLPAGPRVAVISTSGGAGIIAADTCEDLRLELPELDPKTYEAIRGSIPLYGSAHNPVDITANLINDAQGFKTCLNAILQDPNVDSLLVIQTMITGESGKRVAQDLVNIRQESSKPVVVIWTAGEKTNQECFDILKAGGMPYFKTPAAGVRAIKAMVDYNEFHQKRSQPGSDDAGGLLWQPGGGEIAEIRALLRQNGTLTEHQAKSILRRYQLPLPREGLATTAEMAVSIAEEIGYPVVMKIESNQILHKTEAGGVRLDLSGPREVRAAFETIMANAVAYDRHAEIRGVLVQEMVGSGIEAIVGVNNDPQFGPVVMFGLGGIYVEVLKDVAFRLAPLSRQDAEEMVREIKGFPLLRGVRGRGPADIQAVVDVLIKVSLLAIDLKDDLAELDINPLIVLPEGKGAKVADALILSKNLP